MQSYKMAAESLSSKKLFVIIQAVSARRCICSGMYVLCDGSITGQDRIPKDDHKRRCSEDRQEARNIPKHRHTAADLRNHSHNERSFSALKYIRNYLRSTMSDIRLNGLLLCVHQDIPLNHHTVIDDFAKTDPRLQF